MTFHCLAVALRTVSCLHTLSCVSLPATKKPAQKGRFLHTPGDIRRVWTRSAARLSDILRGSYLVPEQSPTSSQTAPFDRRSAIIQHPAVCVKVFSQIFLEFFAKFARYFEAAISCGHLSSKNTRKHGIAQQNAVLFR